MTNMPSETGDWKPKDGPEFELFQVKSALFRQRKQSGGEFVVIVSNNSGQDHIVGVFH